MSERSRISSTNEDSSSVPLSTVTWETVSCSMSQPPPPYLSLQVLISPRLGKQVWHLITWLVQFDIILCQWLSLRSKLAIWNPEHALLEDLSFFAGPGLNLRSQINCMSAISAQIFSLFWKIQRIGGTIPHWPKAGNGDCRWESEHTDGVRTGINTHWCRMGKYAPNSIATIYEKKGRSRRGRSEASRHLSSVWTFPFKKDLFFQKPNSLKLTGSLFLKSFISLWGEFPTHNIASFHP